VPLCARARQSCYALSAEMAMTLCCYRAGVAGARESIRPTLNSGLVDSWFVTLYPSYDIRINYGDPVSGQTRRLFLRSVHR